MFIIVVVAAASVVVVIDNSLNLNKNNYLLATGGNVYTGLLAAVVISVDEFDIDSTEGGGADVKGPGSDVI